MGCVSSSLLNQDDDDFTQIGSTRLGHHFVSLTSTTYGLLTLDPPLPSSPSPNPKNNKLASFFPTRTPVSGSEPEVINSWELMAGLDSNDSFRFSPLPYSLPNSKPSTPKFFTAPPKLHNDKENSNPNRPLNRTKLKPNSLPKCPCPPNGENKAVLYTTTLRGVRKTFEACNAVRSAIQGLGFSICERDISMDRGFREELKQLVMAMGEKSKEEGDLSMLVPPRLFVKGRYVGGAEEVLRIHEEGGLTELLHGLPKFKPGMVCDGCGDVRFLPCFHCNGSCKLVMVIKQDDTSCVKRMTTVVIRCPDCNENGLVLCPICS